MARTRRGSKGVGYDYGSKRVGSKCYSMSPSPKNRRQVLSDKKLTAKRERALSRINLDRNDILDEDFIEAQLHGVNRGN